MRREYLKRLQTLGGWRGSPLHAQGILLLQVHLHAHIEDHPCMRREYVTKENNNLKIIGSPLHAQGILNSTNNSSCFHRITPACAGNTCAFTNPVPR